MSSFFDFALEEDGKGLVGEEGGGRERGGGEKEGRKERG